MTKQTKTQMLQDLALFIDSDPRVRLVNLERGAYLRLRVELKQADSRGIVSLMIRDFSDWMNWTAREEAASAKRLDTMVTEAIERSSTSLRPKIKRGMCMQHAGYELIAQDHLERNALQAVADTFNNGGATLSGATLAPDLPSYGYLVGVFGGEVVPAIEFNPEHLLAFRVENDLHLRMRIINTNQPVFRIGTWLDGSEVHLDLVQWTDSLAEAIKVGERFNQRELYDCSTRRSIPLGEAKAA